MRMSSIMTNAVAGSEMYTFRTFEEISHVLRALATRFPVLAAAELGLTELMVNAVEHGNLGISFEEKGRLMEKGGVFDAVEERLARAPYRDRIARIMVIEGRDAFVVTVTDEGQGFDWRCHLESDMDDAERPHGRGIKLSQAVFSSLTYEGRGNVAVATVRKDRRSGGRNAA